MVCFFDMAWNKWAWKSSMMKINRWLDHSFLNKNPEKNKALSNETRQQIIKNNTHAPLHDVNFPSETFGQIKLKELRNHDYTVEDIVKFFITLDHVDTLYVYVNVPSSPFILNDTLVGVVVGPDTYTLPASLLWLCLPYAVKQKFGKHKNYFTIYKELFAAYDKNFVAQKNVE
ncbi:MAG: hypothetical protein ACD_80C00232G0003 [uncultured bacterium (gcode 4)]|uniref:Uncharacterized protein n=1 Tax=uncultured bacterium (gcode 4) TaxID=1234023 RepID=K1XVJ1_9BACT|nr:MAG: hypothetical protein ACD_80C00232G0003 [uncultured bacterium (gcode 4)]